MYRYRYSGTVTGKGTVVQVQVYFTVTLYRYTVQRHCTGTLYRYTVQVHCTGTLYRYTVQVHCTGTLYRYSFALFWSPQTFRQPSGSQA